MKKLSISQNSTYLHLKKLKIFDFENLKIKLLTNNKMATKFIRSRREKLLGEKIREWRKKHGISQEELAKRLGVTQEAVSYWESGKKHPKREVFKKLIEITNREIKPEDYLG